MSARASNRAIILPVVLVLIGLLALMAAGFMFFTKAETAGTIAQVDSQQARLTADSGLEEVITVLRKDRDNFGAWWDVPKQFRNALVWAEQYKRDGDPVRAAGGSRQQLYEKGVPSPAWRYSVVAANLDGPQNTIRYGITPESSKLNLNTASDQQIEALLVPILTRLQVENPQELVNALLDWRDPDNEPREGGAENEYYNTLDPPYSAKNGPLDTIEELLLIKGFNARVLYGEDTNGNGVLDPNEDDGEESAPVYDNGDGILDFGIVPYITVWSREPDTSLDNKPRINLNDSAAAIYAQIQTNIQEGELSEATIEYILQLKRRNFNFAQFQSPADLYISEEELAAQQAVETDQENQAGVGGQGDQAGQGGQPGQGGQGGQGGRRGQRGQAGQNDQTGQTDQANQGDQPVTNDQSSQGDQPVPRGQRGRGGRSGQSGQSGQNDQTGQTGQDTTKPGQRRQATQQPAQNSQRTQGGSNTQGAGNTQGDQGAVGGGQRNAGTTGRVGLASADSPVTLQEMSVIMDRFTTRSGQSGGRGGSGAGGGSSDGMLSGLINVNTAPRAVLSLIPDITTETVDKIIDMRLQLSPDTMHTTAWPLVSGALDSATFKKIAPYITTKSYQFRVEILGYADHVKLARRYEWIIEMVGPLAQVKYYRDLTSLDRAWPVDDDKYTVTTGR